MASAYSRFAGRMAIHSCPSAIRCSTENAKNRLRDTSQKVDTRSLAQQKATEMMLQLLQKAKAAAIPARHILFDAWFCSLASLLKIHGLGYEMVAMAKKTEKISYLH